MSGRCSPTEAVNILRPAWKDVVAAADKLTQATHAGLNVYVNGQKVHAGFLPHILVVGECQPDGEWTAHVTSTVKIGGIGPSDQCEFDVDQVKALLPQPELEKRPWPTVSGSVSWSPPAILAPATPPPEEDPAPEPRPSEIDQILEGLPRRPVGRPAKHDWQAINAEIARRCIDQKTGRVKVPKSERKLAQAILKWCQDNSKKEPAESEMRDAVRAVCTALRPLQK